MKKMKANGLILTAGVLALSLALTGCGSSADAGSAASEPAAEAASTAESTAESTAAAAAAPAAAVADDGALQYKGVAIRPGDSAAPVLEALGDPDDYTENISCMFESGMDKTYTYADLVLYTYPTADDEKILLADATGPEAATARGAKVGDALDATLLQYAAELTPESTDRYTCTFGDVLFAVVAEDGVVSDISVELAETPNR